MPKEKFIDYNSRTKGLGDKIANKNKEESNMREREREREKVRERNAEIDREYPERYSLYIHIVISNK